MPKGPRKFHFSFERSGLTRFSRLSLFQSFCKSLGLRHFLQLYVRCPIITSNDSVLERRRKRTAPSTQTV